MTKNTTPTLPMRRRPATGNMTSQTAGHREADAHAPNGDVSVRAALVAGGLRSLTVREMFA